MTIRDTLLSYNYETIKFIMLQNHYRTDLDISKTDFEIAEKHLYYFYNTIIKAKKYIDLYRDDDLASNNLEIKEKFINAMDDDFSSHLAIANLYMIFKYLNNLLDSSQKEKSKITGEIKSILKDVTDTYKVLGLFEQEPEKYVNEIRLKYLKKMNLNLEYIKNKIDERIKAKENGNFDIADKIRAELKVNGIDLRDTKEGTIWDFSILYK